MIESPRFLELKDRIRTHLAAAEFDLARAVANEALAEANVTGDRDAIDLAICNRAMIAILEGRPADQELAEMREILLRSGHPVVAFSAAYAAAAIYKDRRDFKKAISYSRRAREAALSAEEHPGRGHAFNQLGTLFLLESRIPEAIEAFERAQTLFSAVRPPDRFAMAILDDNLGYAYLLDGRHADGFRLCTRSLDAFATAGAESYMAQPHLDLCFGYLEVQKLELAIHHGEQALALARRHVIPEVVKNALYLVGEARYLSGDAVGADTCFEELSSLYPEVRYLKDFLYSVDLKKVINLRL